MGAFQVTPMLKNLPAMQETRVLSLGLEDPLEKGMATHSSAAMGDRELLSVCGPVLKPASSPGPSVDHEVDNSNLTGVTGLGEELC